MTDSFVTQCPHCQTRFKVNHNQLSVARGAVRCGACKQVFNAARQLLEQSTAATGADLRQALDEPPITPMPAPAHLQAGQPTWQSAEPDLDHLDLDDELARLERRPAHTTPTGKPPSELSAQRDQAEDWPDDLFGNHQDDAEPLAEMNMSAEGRQEPRLGTGDGSLPSPPTHGLEPQDAARLQAYVEAAPTTRQARSEPELREEHLLTLQDDPLQLQWEKPHSSPGKQLLWAGLTVLAALALLTQYVVFHFDELARQEAYRPWFITLCPAVGCSVPSRVDIQLIRSSNLVVRSHPSFAGALVVDAIIYNRAPFSQPFPLLELRFADLNNKLIASRRFKPSEYLSGDLSGQTEMPPQVPIHIALDILDPGKRAVNYSLSFHSPE